MGEREQKRCPVAPNGRDLPWHVHDDWYASLRAENERLRTLAHDLRGWGGCFCLMLSRTDKHTEGCTWPETLARYNAMFPVSAEEESA